MDYRIISRNNGDSYFCIVLNENENMITTLMPMLVEKMKVPIGPNAVRETYSASQMCPFTDDRVFSFFKHDLLFAKPMNQDTVEFYIRMINTHEDPETMTRYKLDDLIHPYQHTLKQSQEEVEDEIEQLAEQMIDDEEDDGERILH